MGTKKAKVGLGIRLSPVMLQGLQQVCKQMGVSKAELIRGAIERELDRLALRKSRGITL